MDDGITVEQEVAKLREALEWIREQTSGENDCCVCPEVHDKAGEVLGQWKYVYLVEYLCKVISSSSSFEGARVLAGKRYGDRLMVRDYDASNDLHQLRCGGEETHYWIRRVRLED